MTVMTVQAGKREIAIWAVPQYERPRLLPSLRKANGGDVPWPLLTETEDAIAQALWIAGRWISVEDIEARVYPGDLFTDTGRLRAHVANMRRKGVPIVGYQSRLGRPTMYALGWRA